MPRVCATRAERTPRLGGMRARDLGARGVQKLGTISSTPTKRGGGLEGRGFSHWEHNTCALHTRSDHWAVAQMLVI
jgi:hypothetical protein